MARRDQLSTKNRRQIVGAGMLLAAAAQTAQLTEAQAQAPRPARSARRAYTFVLVHGAWHSGDLLEGVARHLRAAGHRVHLPTLAGNGPGDRKTSGLNDAIESLVAYFRDNRISDAVLLGHSYGGMVITGAADRLPEGTIRRIVYWSAFVPHDGESLEDLNPPAFNALFKQIEQPDGGLALPYEIWRDGLMNDADEDLARFYFAKLNPQPYNAMREKIRLQTNPAATKFGKSYIHCQEDMGYPPSMGGWLRFYERLGLCRFISMPGGHEVCFSNPKLLAQKIVEAGRD